jgi:hypothetical protein
MITNFLKGKSQYQSIAPSSDCIASLQSDLKSYLTSHNVAKCDAVAEVIKQQKNGTHKLCPVGNLNPDPYVFYQQLQGCSPSAAAAAPQR